MDAEELTDSFVAAALAQTDIGVAKITHVRENGVNALLISVVHVGNSTYEFKKLLEIAPGYIKCAHNSYLGVIDDIKKTKKITIL